MTDGIRAPSPNLLLAAGLLVAAAFALYGAALGYPLVFDDYHLNAYSLSHYYAEALERFGRLRWLSDATYGWLGTSIVAQRAANVLLHAATGVLLYGFFARLFAVTTEERHARWLAFFGALWFVLHPVAVYGTAYLMQRSIVLATACSIAALWCVLEALLRRSAAWYAAAAILYFLALSAKEHAVMLPAVALALAVLVRASWRDLGWWLAALAAIGATVIIQRRGYLGALYEPFAAEILGPDVALAFALSVLNQAALFFRYLATWLVPWPGWISVDVRTPFPHHLVGWHDLAFIAWLAYGALAIWLLRQRGRLGLAGLGLLFPWLLALTEMVAVRVQEPFVLYRSYLWMSGLPAIAPALLARLPARWQIGAFAAVCLALGIAAHERVQTFASNYALWDDAARKNTDLSAARVERAYVNRGIALLEAGRFAPAAADLDRALELNARSPDAYLARATLRLRSNRLPEALADLDRALELDPAYASAHNKRCLVNMGLGRMAQALADCEKATALAPLDEEPWINRGVALRELKRPADAAASYERALQLRPRSGSAHFNYGVLLLDAGRRDEEVRHHFFMACEARIPDACMVLQQLGGAGG